MREPRKLAAKIAGALLLAVLFVPSTFADWRHDRIATEGRISSIYRERGGYRITLDRGDYSFFLTNREVANAPRRLWVSDLRVGMFIRVSGYLGRNGYVDADAIEWRGDSGWGNGNRQDRAVLRGVVRRVDLRHDRIEVRDLNSGRTIVVDVARVDRHGRGIDLDDLRRGDRITLFGTWRRGDVFGAERIESYRAY